MSPELCSREVDNCLFGGVHLLEEALAHEDVFVFIFINFIIDGIGNIISAINNGGENSLALLNAGWAGAISFPGIDGDSPHPHEAPGVAGPAEEEEPEDEEAELSAFLSDAAPGPQRSPHAGACVAYHKPEDVELVHLALAGLGGVIEVVEAGLAHL